MGVHANFFVARDAVAHQYVENPTMFDPDSADYKGMTTSELSGLWALLQGVEWEMGLLDEFEIVVNEDEGECTIERFPGPMVSALADLSAQQAQLIAQKWYEADEFESPELCAEILADLVRLARRALETRQNVYLFNLV